MRKNSVINLDEKLSFDKHLARCQNTIQQKWNLLKRFIFSELSVENQNLFYFK